MTKPGTALKWIAADGGGSAAGQIAWILAAAGAGFLVSFGAVAMAALPRDGFVLLHLTVTGTLLALYMRTAGIRRVTIFHNWPLGLTLGGLAAAFSVSFVLHQPGSAGPEGWQSVLGALWLGGVYGVIDALLLTVLPVHAVWCMAQKFGWLRRWPGWVATGSLSLLASLLVTAAYHFGFPEFQGPQIVQPLIGNTVITLAYILSASPLSPLTSHVALHVAAVFHAYWTSVPLPPHY